MKRMVMSLMIIAACFIFSQTAIGQTNHLDVMVKFSGEVNKSLVEKYTQTYKVLSSTNLVRMTITTEQLKDLKQESGLTYVEVDEPVQLNNVDRHWGFKDVQASTAHDVGYTGKGIKIGIIDTGIDLNHADLRVAGGQSFVDYTSSYQDDDGHGTHIAGIIAAQKNDIGITGIAPDAEIYALKTFDTEGVSSQFDLVSAVEWSIANGLDIINLSFTSESITNSLKNTLLRAHEKGILIVASAGNFKEEETLFEVEDVMYPARLPEVISVGSINNKIQLSKFSYYGPSIDFVAPGEMIYSSYLSTAGEYAWMSGTSMAAPYVTGSLALYKEAYPNYTNLQIEAIAKETSIDLGPKGFDSTFGYGLIQVPITASNEEKIEVIGEEVINPFLDVIDADWYTDAVLTLSNKGIITGYGDGTFRPTNEVTRAEAITMLMRAMELKDGASEVLFPDIDPTSFAYKSIKLAVGHGIIKGLPDGTFGYGLSITRADTAVILQRAYQFEEVTSSVLLDVMPDYYANSVHSLFARGYITGYTDGTFKPLNSITRAEFANILYKIMLEKETE